MHLNISKELLKKRYLDKIIYLPTGASYVKNGLISFKDRFNMVKLMIEDYDYLYVSDIGDFDNFKYTYQTLDYFNNNKDEIYFICGTDNLAELDTWMKYKYILEKYKEYKNNIIITNIESKKISSTIIRNKLKVNKSNLNKLVYDYIISKGIYR